MGWTAALTAAGTGLQVLGSYKQGQAQAESAKYNAAIQSNNLQYQQHLNEYEAEHQKELIRQQLESAVVNKQLSDFKADYTYDAAQIEYDETVKAVTETVDLQFGELTRQQDALVANAYEAARQVNEKTADDKSDRIREADRDLATLRVIGGERGIGSSTFTRKIQETAYFKGVDLGRIDANRRNQLTVLENNTASQIASLQASKKDVSNKAKQVLVGAGLRISQATVENALDKQLSDYRLTQAEYQAEVETRYIDGKTNYAKKATDVTVENTKRGGDFAADSAKDAGIAGAGLALATGGAKVVGML